ncbi:hypothetical protein MLD38_000062 [Melastoma candidum]|uniref:Uncharacterized protein n=1 Tax=Melastoma candidum TaxID=119954 RepID=A0ACB9S903_9MYRT|nr:hypothetical protein MLD38_000062 [Melastoma candidum]
MAGMRLQTEESASTAPVQSDLISDDDRSVAADSWSIKSEYGSTLDDDQRHVDAADALNFRSSTAFDYGSDKEEGEADGISSELGLQSYWNAAYADELTNFREHGLTGEIWFGADVMHVVTSWTRSLCLEISRGRLPISDSFKEEPVEDADKYLCDWSVLDLGTGNGLLLQELAKEGFSDLTGIDYSEGAVELARSLANRDGFPNIKFLVDDVLESKLDTQFKLVIDKGTLDAIGLHPDGPIKRIMYWDSVSKLVASGGLLVITSCNSSKDELLQEVDNYNKRQLGIPLDTNTEEDQDISGQAPFRYINHVRSYPTFTFGGIVGSRVSTVAFLRK